MNSLITNANWFCIHSLPKHERIAASHLSKFHNIEIFYPQIKFRKSGRNVRQWIVEPLFPSYLFARFEIQTLLQQIRYTPGVKDVVGFGNTFISISNDVIEELYLHVNDQHIVIIEPIISIGQKVEVSSGILKGLQTTVTQLIPSKERIKILFDFLGINSL